MPDFPIIDSHLHLWNPEALPYSWLASNALLNRPYLLNDYYAATEAVEIEAMVFIQCEAEPSAFEAEAEWVAELALRDPRIRGMVAWAPLEKGRAVRDDLERLTRHHILRGIRRIIQFEPDLNFCLRPDFIAGVRTLADFDLPFDICIDHRHMHNALKFVETVPDVPMVLDHIGKPAIKEGAMQPWADRMRELATFSKVSCKISGVATEADHNAWTVDELKRYIEVAIEAFGFDRILFGGDWPVATQAISFTRWVAILEEMMVGVNEIDQRKFWRDNAVRVYGLEL
ncbi:MAG: amidohydrolase family protein [Terriglobales bacterium]